MIVFFIIGRQLLKNAVWRNFGWYSLIFGAVTLASYGIIVYAAHRASALVGILERFMFIEVFIWYIIMTKRSLTSEK